MGVVTVGGFKAFKFKWAVLVDEPPPSINITYY